VANVAFVLHIVVMFRHRWQQMMFTAVPHCWVLSCVVSQSFGSVQRGCVVLEFRLSSETTGTALPVPAWLALLEAQLAFQEEQVCTCGQLEVQLSQQHGRLWKIPQPWLAALQQCSQFQSN